VRLNDPAVLAEVTAAFQVYEQARDDNDVATLTALFWRNPLTIRRPTPSSSNATPVAAGARARAGCARRRAGAW
jgi:hypothetical protein